MVLNEETLAAVLGTRVLELETLLALRITCKSFCNLITGHFPDILIAIYPRADQLLVIVADISADKAPDTTTSADLALPAVGADAPGEAHSWLKPETTHRFRDVCPTAARLCCSQQPGNARDRV